MKLLRIKWENIMVIMVGTFYTYCIAKHMINNGFDMNILMFEILIYGLEVAMIYVATKHLRKMFL